MLDVYFPMTDPWDWYIYSTIIYLRFFLDLCQYTVQTPWIWHGWMVQQLENWGPPEDPETASMSHESWLFKNGIRIFHLVGGFNPFEKYLSKLESSSNRDENKKYFKPPPSHGFLEIIPKNHRVGNFIPGI